VLVKIALDYETKTNICVARVQGDIDAFTVPELKTQLEGALRRGCDSIVLDLSGVSYLDSSALGLIVWLNRILEPREGRLVLAGATGDVTRILEISGLVGTAPTVSAAADTTDAIAGLTLAEPTGPALWTQLIQLRATPSSLGDVREQICNLLDPLQLPGSTLFDIRVGVGEALSNAVRHGSPRGESDEVSVSVSAYEDRVVITVTDQGSGFNGFAAGSGDPYAASGRGVMFMRALMDQVEFTPLEGGGTSVTLVKHLGRRE
jgi:anti-sigma B factor antagonist